VKEHHLFAASPTRRYATRLIDGDLSIELTPGEERDFEPDVAVFPFGSRVFLTHIATRPPGAQLDAAIRLIDRGYRPVPHLAARNFASAADYAQQVERLSSAGVEEALFIGGNPAAPRGPFQAAAELLAHPVLSRNTLRTAWLAGYPEGHPSLTADQLKDALEQKLAICRERGLSPCVVSQFGFHGAVIARWAREFVSTHPDIPLRLGFAGVTSPPKLIGYALRCGIGPSIALLRKTPRTLFGLVAEHDPGDLVEAVEQTGLRAHAPAELHFFTFGGWRKTLDWIAARRANGNG